MQYARRYLINNEDFLKLRERLLRS